MRLNYLMIFVSDMQRAVAFYRDVLGLPLRFESPQWTEFETGGATLALHPSADAADMMDDPDGVPAGRCRPGLAVPDLDAFHHRMEEKNVRCVQPPTELHGACIARYLDPDGLCISVGEERRAS